MARTACSPLSQLRLSEPSVADAMGCVGEVPGDRELGALAGERRGGPWRHGALERALTESIEDAMHPVARSGDERLRRQRGDRDGARRVRRKPGVRALHEGRASLAAGGGGDLVDVETAAQHGGHVGLVAGVAAQHEAIDVPRRVEAGVGPERKERIGEGAERVAHRSVRVHRVHVEARHDDRRSRQEREGIGVDRGASRRPKRRPCRRTQRARKKRRQQDRRDDEEDVPAGHADRETTATDTNRGA